MINGGFEEAGAASGSATGWVESFVSSLEDFADFAENPSDADTASQETFDAGWTGGDDQVFLGAFAGETLDLTAAIFDVGVGQVLVERFERGWGFAPQRLEELGAQDPAQFGGESVEDFSAGWGTVLLDREDFEAALVAAAFEPGTREIFGWSDFVVELPEPAEAVARFGDGLEEETFEDVVEPTQVTVLTGDEFGYAQEPAIQVGDVVRFSSDGELPGDVRDDTDYHVATTSTLPASFQISAQALLSPLVEFSDSPGTGTHLVHRDPHLFWSELLGAL